MKLYENAPLQTKACDIPDEKRLSSDICKCWFNSVGFGNHLFGIGNVKYNALHDLLKS